MYEVIDIKIERTNILLKLNKNIKENCYLKTNNKKTLVNTEKDQIEINIANIPEGNMIEEGKWYISINNEILKLNNNIINKLEDISRIYKYRNNTCALLLSFEIDEEYNLYINTNYMIKNKKYKKIYTTQEGQNIKEKIKIINKIISIKIINIIYKIIFLLNNKNNYVLFLTENNNELTGNLKKIYEQINTKHKTLIYSNTNKKIINKIKELIYISKSKYIFIDNYIQLLTPIKTSSKQIIIQLWHAGIGFKAVGYSRFGKQGSPHPFHSSHRKNTYIIVEEENLKKIYSEVFGCEQKKILATGIPRLEKYLDKKTIEQKTKEIYNKNKILKEKKIILFAPTYRGENAEKAYYDYSKINLKKINKFCTENNFIFIIKMHPFIKEKIVIEKEYQNNIIDLSEEEINDLIYITDIMITDYSSCAYEYSYFNKPLVFYRYDKEIYEYIRGIHTMDLFTKNRYETNNFDKLMEILEKLKNIKNTEKNISNYKNNSCSTIENYVFKENLHDRN